LRAEGLRPLRNTEMATTDAKVAAQAALKKKAARGAAPDRSVPVVQFEDVTKVYDGGHVGLERVSMRIGRGEFVFLVGPTGCGKSTCIRLLMKELEPTSGIVSVAGRSLNDVTAKRLPYLRRNIGVIFQ